MFTSKLLPRREASIPKAVGESSPELGTPDVALMEHTVPTRPTPPPSQSATCWCPLLLPLLPGSPRTSHSCPRSAAVLPAMEAHTSVLPRAWGGEGRELLVLGCGSYQAVGHAEFSSGRPPDPRSRCFNRSLGPGGASSCVSVPLVPPLPGGVSWEQSQLFLFKQLRGIEDLCDTHWLSPDLTCLLWGLAPEGDF